MSFGNSGFGSQRAAGARKGDPEAAKERADKAFQRKIDHLSERPKQSPASYALWLLSKREYSASMLTEKLTRRGYGAEEVAAAMAQLQARGLQSDERFAASRVRGDGARYGDKGIRYRLSTKGIGDNARDLVDQELATLEPEADRAVTAAVRFEGKDLDERLRAKIWRFLAGRGFSRESIEAAMRHLGAVLVLGLDGEGGPR